MSRNTLFSAVVLLFVVFTTASHAQEARLGADARLEAWELHREMAEQSAYRNLRWQTLGPKFAGGRIESIDAPRGQPGTIYAGIGAGGIWKTTNGGLSWTPVFDDQSTFAIGDLTVAPSDPSTIWVGTGECHLSGTSYQGTGVFKSTDGGESWTNMGLHESAHIGKVVIHPTDPEIVYVAAMGYSRVGGERGVYKTTDGGLTFRRVLFAGDSVAFVDLVLDPTDPTRLYAAGWDRRGRRDGGIFRSEDAGDTWDQVGKDLLDGNIDRVALDAATSEPGVVYALMVDRSSPNLRRRGLAAVLFRSDDHGTTWERTHENYVPTYVGWDFCDVRVAADDANRVYVGGLRLIVSSDGGKTFEGEGGFAPNTTRENVFRLHAHRGMGMHLDVHDIWLDPEHPSRVMLGNDGGLFVSWDRGQTWLHLNNLPIAEFYRIHLDDQKPFRIWGGTQDNASFVGPSTARFETGEDDKWEYVFLDPWTGGDGFSTFPDPHDPEIVFYSQQVGDLKRSRLGRLRAEKRIRPRNRRGEPELNFAWDTPFFASQHGERTVLYCAAQRVLRSTDRGDSWEPISPDLKSGSLVALAESPRDPGRLAAGGGRGRTHFTTDGGETWTQGAKLPGKTMRDIVLSHHDSNRAWAVLSGKSDNDSASYVFVTNDFGKSWQPLAGNLPHEPVNALAEDATTEGLLFVGTDLGVYVSINGGAHWQSLCSTLPTAPVVDLAVHGRDGKLVAATHGLSLFLLDIQSIRSDATDQRSAEASPKK